MSFLRVAMAGIVAMQELVEGPLPRGEVDGRRLGEHTVEVEQAGTDRVREAEHAGTVPAAGPPRGVLPNSGVHRLWGRASSADARAPSALPRVAVGDGRRRTVPPGTPERGRRPPW